MKRSSLKNWLISEEEGTLVSGEARLEEGLLRWGGDGVSWTRDAGRIEIDETTTISLSRSSEDTRRLWLLPGPRAHWLNISVRTSYSRLHFRASPPQPGELSGLPVLSGEGATIGWEEARAFLGSASLNGARLVMDGDKGAAHLSIYPELEEEDWPNPKQAFLVGGASFMLAFLVQVLVALVMGEGVGFFTGLVLIPAALIYFFYKRWRVDADKPSGRILFFTLVMVALLGFGTLYGGGRWFSFASSGPISVASLAHEEREGYELVDAVVERGYSHRFQITEEGGKRGSVTRFYVVAPLVWEGWTEAQEVVAWAVCRGRELPFVDGCLAGWQRGFQIGNKVRLTGKEAEDFEAEMTAFASRKGLTLSSSPKLLERSERIATAPTWGVHLYWVLFLVWLMGVLGLLGRAEAED